MPLEAPELPITISYRNIIEYYFYFYSYFAAGQMLLTWIEHRMYSSNFRKALRVLG